MMNHTIQLKNFLLTLLVPATMLSGCRYMRETPSYREGSAATRPQNQRSSPSEETEFVLRPDNDYYKQKSQLLGYELTGNENPDLLEEIASWLNTPYRHGGTTRSGVDCSGLALNIYRDVYNTNLDRVTVNMAQRISKINRRHLREGDLIFFRISSREVSHVGIYISKDRFVHSSTSRGVIVSDLNEEYYSSRFAFGGRVQR